MPYTRAFSFWLLMLNACVAVLYCLRRNARDDSHGIRHPLRE